MSVCSKNMWVYCDMCKSPTRKKSHLVRKTIEGRVMEVCSTCNKNTCDHTELVVGRQKAIVDDERIVRITMRCGECNEDVEGVFKVEKTTVEEMWAPY